MPEVRAGVTVASVAGSFASGEQVVAPSAYQLNGAVGPTGRGGSVSFRSSVGYAARCAAIAVGYFAFTEIGKAVYLKGPAGAFWPSAGLGIAILYLGGFRWWPAVLLGDLGSLASDVIQLGVAPGTAVAEAAGDLARTIVAVVILERLVGPRIALDRLREAGAVLLAVVCGAAIAATVAALAQLASNAIGSAQILGFWRSWWLGDVCGGLVVLSLALAWARGPGAVLRHRVVPEGAVVIAAVVGLSLVALSPQAPLTYLVFPALIWAALRLGPQGATLALTIAVAIAVFVTSNALGPFVGHTPTENALNLQLYIAVAAITTLYVTALVSERGRATLALADSRARIVAAADTERRRIERDLHDGAQQRLVAAAINLTLADEVDGDARVLHERIGESRREIEEALIELREIAHGIYPTSLARSGLSRAFDWLARRYRGKVVVTEATVGRFSPEIELAFYYCSLEAVQNVSKHAGPQAHIWIRLYVNADQLHLEVRDNGSGFDVDRTRDGIGLQSMSDRLGAVGGRVDVASGPGKGTLVAASVPVGRHPTTPALC